MSDDELRAYAKLALIWGAVVFGAGALVFSKVDDMAIAIGLIAGIGISFGGLIVRLVMSVEEYQERWGKPETQGRGDDPERERWGLIAEVSQAFERSGYEIEWHASDDLGLDVIATRGALRVGIKCVSLGMGGCEDWMDFVRDAAGRQGCTDSAIVLPNVFSRTKSIQRFGGGNPSLVCRRGIRSFVRQLSR